MVAGPAPASALLLKGYEFFDDGLEGERITPTGAAILKHLQATQRPHRGTRRLLRTGNGFGTSTFPGISNVLRVLAFEEVHAPTLPPIELRRSLSRSTINAGGSCASLWIIYVPIQLCWTCCRYRLSARRVG